MRLCRIHWIRNEGKVTFNVLLMMINKNNIIIGKTKEKRTTNCVWPLPTHTHSITAIEKRQSGRFLLNSLNQLRLRKDNSGRRLLRYCHQTKTISEDQSEGQAYQ